MNTYATGTKVTITGTFKDINNALVDPTTVTAQIQLPDNEIIDISDTLVNDSTGVYSVSYTPVLGGGHKYKMEGSGNCEISAYGSFKARNDF